LFNLGNVKLSPSENIVLGLGLEFLPKTQSDTASIQRSLTHSLESYINRIRTNIYFKDTKYTPNNIPALLSPPTNTISTSIDTYLDIYKTNITHQINTYNFTNHLTHINQLIRNYFYKLFLY